MAEMAASGAVSMPRSTIRQVQRQQQRRQVRAHELAAEQHAQDDGADGQALDPAVGLDQLRRRQQLGEDAVLGRRVGRRAQPHHGVGQQRVAAEQHHQAAHHLDAVADEHDAALGQRIGEGADEGRQHDVEQREHRHQGGALPFGGARRAQQLDRGDEQRVVGQRAEELRRHDGRETFFHRVARRHAPCAARVSCLHLLGAGGL